MFQPPYNVNKLFNRSVSWYFIDRLSYRNPPYSLLWVDLRELAGVSEENYLHMCFANYGKYPLFLAREDEL